MGFGGSSWALAPPANLAEAQFTPDLAGVTDRSGLWVGRFKPSAMANYLIKYDNALNPVFARPYGVAQGFSDYAFGDLVPLRDGGLIVIGESNVPRSVNSPPGYSFHRVDSAGNPVWSLQGLTDVYYFERQFFDVRQRFFRRGQRWCDLVSSER